MTAIVDNRGLLTLLLLAAPAAAVWLMVKTVEAVGHLVFGRPAPSRPGPSRPPRTTGPRSRRPANRRRHAKPKRTAVAPPRGLEVPPRPTIPPRVRLAVHDAATQPIPRLPKEHAA